MIGKFLFSAFIGLAMFIQQDCDGKPLNTTAKDEQAYTEVNQRKLLTNQPPPSLDWSLERDNLAKRMVMMNDRSLYFYLYIFSYGAKEPIGYYLINKVSSVDSQLTNTEQIVYSRTPSDGAYSAHTLPSPSEDGSYGTNGEAMFGFTPEGLYIEWGKLSYMVSTAPLNFSVRPPNLGEISSDDKAKITELMKRVEEKIKKK